MFTTVHVNRCSSSSPKTNIIRVSFNVDEILKIDDAGQTITFSSYLNVEWTEPRLQFTAKHEDDAENEMFPVELEIIKQLWLPNIYIYNLKNFKSENHGFPKLSGIWLSSKGQLENIR